MEIYLHEVCLVSLSTAQAISIVNFYGMLRLASSIGIFSSIHKCMEFLNHGVFCQVCNSWQIQVPEKTLSWLPSLYRHFHIFYCFVLASSQNKCHFPIPSARYYESFQFLFWCGSCITFFHTRSKARKIIKTSLKSPRIYIIYLLVWLQCLVSISRQNNKMKERVTSLSYTIPIEVMLKRHLEIARYSAEWSRLIFAFRVNAHSKYDSNQLLW